MKGQRRDEGVRCGRKKGRPAGGRESGEKFWDELRGGSGEEGAVREDLKILVPWVSPERKIAGVFFYISSLRFLLVP